MILEEELGETTKQEYYLAQIAAEVRRSYVKKPSRFKLKDFLISFRRSNATVQQEPITTEDKKKHIANSKASWMISVGVKKKK